MDTSIGGDRREFPSTRWSTIRQAGNRNAPEYAKAVDELCSLYWKPVYAYVRAARGYGNEEAKDITQEFLLEMVNGGMLARFAPDRGNFRSYLRSAVHMFLLEHHRKESALKRGGGRMIVTIAPGETDLVDRLVAGSAESADTVFERQWARSVLDHAVTDLRDRLVADGKEETFRLFERHEISTHPGESPTHADLAREFGWTEAEVNNRLVNCRKVLRELVITRIQDYVESKSEVDEEVGRLFSR